MGSWCPTEVEVGDMFAIEHMIQRRKAVTARVFCVSIIFLLIQGCGGEKHLPSSNPPEYDPKKVYTAPASPANARAASVAKPAEPGSPAIELPPLEPGPNEKGEWKKVPVNPESLQLFKNIKSPCEALLNIVQGLGSAQLFAGAEGQALKQSLGSQAESVAQSLDQQLFDNFKAQLGPTVADCLSPVLFQKSSGLEEFFPPGRVVYTSGQPTGAFQLAQASAIPAGEDGYTETKSESTQNAPPGWVGRKTTTRTIRVGNKPETAGNRRSIVIILGGKVLKCPAPDGVVPGDFEFAVVDQTIMNVESGVTRMVHIGLRAAATLKGQVGDDAQIQYVEGDLTTVAERGGTDVPTSVRRRHSQFRFVPSHDEFHPGFPTNITGTSATGWDIEGASQQEDGFAGAAAGAVMFWGGQTYSDAQREWHKPNTCVEITFTPATKTKKFVPSESTPVKPELRTKEGSKVIPAKFKEAKERPRERNGTVSPREEKSQPGTPATFTYQAPATRVKHSGFWVGAVSRAGVAEAKDGEWELADASYVLEFQSRIVSSEITEPVESVAAAKVVLTPVEGKEGWYRGSGILGYQTGPPPNRDPCSNLVMGHGTTGFEVAGISIKLSDGTGATGHQTGSADIELHYLIHPTNETVRPWTMVEFQCVPGKELPDPFFFSMYAVARGANEVNRLKGWTYVGKDGVVAKKVLRGNCGDSCEDQTIFLLKEADDSAAQPK